MSGLSRTHGDGDARRRSCPAILQRITGGQWIAVGYRLLRLRTGFPCKLNGNSFETPRLPQHCSSGHEPRSADSLARCKTEPNPQKEWRPSTWLDELGRGGRDNPEQHEQPPPEQRRRRRRGKQFKHSKEMREGGSCRDAEGV
ncbi:unnamed protein product [Pleuronectes platessa]|uniref:Uncharacterized protein n=1 Tax=Pleuronectes platessa TaxID=8262 RepID=A0A9N7UXG8_PLEPL|nr:unnamed protein product [Pleuronectes platessa]